MRIVTTLVAALVVAAPAVGHADDREALQAKGEEQAKEGRYGEAIESFKAADKIQPRATHACLIALAYTRRELWPQAELFLSICHQRANAGDPLPDWVEQADQQIKERLAAANVVEVTIKTTPPTARVTVSSFAPDEVFEPRTIHLPVGTHVIFAKAEGYLDAQYTLQLKDRSPQQVVINLTPLTEKHEPGSPTGPGEPVAKRGRPFIIAGSATLVAAVGAHIWWGFEHAKLAQANELPITQDDVNLYNAHKGRYDIAHYTTIGLYAVSAGLLATGIVLRVKSPERASVAAVPLPGGGAMVSVGWQR